jgi:hypothetical protein
MNALACQTNGHKHTGQGALESLEKTSTNDSGRQDRLGSVQPLCQSQYPE